jgi:voltage-gated potassium channel
MAAALVLFFMVPIRPHQSPAVLALEVAVSLASVLVIGWLVLGELVGEWRGRGGNMTGHHLALLFELVLLVFALTYYALSIYSRREMAGLHTRLDALYFTTTTMTTVGYGDIHPVGQVARAVTTVHVAFDVLFAASLVRLLNARLGRAARQASGVGPLAVGNQKSEKRRDHRDQQGTEQGRPEAVDAEVVADTGRDPQQGGIQDE